VAVRVTSWLDLGERWVICLDRTTWQLGGTPINVLVLSVAYGGVSVPLMWTVLGKKGNSSTEERIALIERFLRRFPLERIECLTADREFRGHRWLAYLIQRGIRFRLRIPNNTKTHNRQRNARLPVVRLFSVQIGETMVLNRPRRLWGHTLYLVGTRAPRGEQLNRHHDPRPRTGARRRPPTLANGVSVCGDEAPGLQPRRHAYHRSRPGRSIDRRHDLGAVLVL
jgi:hypothetical protein